MMFKLVLPKVEPTTTSGQVLAWHKAEGDAVEYGDALCDVEMTYRRFGGDRRYLVRLVSSDVGVLRRVLVPVGAAAPVGAAVAILAMPGADGEPPEDPAGLLEFRVIPDMMDA